MEILNPSLESLKRSADLIKRGKVIICPTDTVYGFLADAGDKKAVSRIFKIKKKAKVKALACFCKGHKNGKEHCFYR